MSQITGKKVAVTPMPTPSGASGAIIDSFNTQDDKTVNAPSIHIVEDAITTINDKLTYKVLASVSPNTGVTYGSALQTLYTTYNALSDKEKIVTNLLYGNGVCQLSNLSGIFTQIVMGASGIYGRQFSLSLGTAYNLSTNGTITNVSADTLPDTLYLVGYER